MFISQLIQSIKRIHFDMAVSHPKQMLHDSAHVFVYYKMLKVCVPASNHFLSKFWSIIFFYAFLLYPARNAKPAQMRVGCSESPAKKTWLLGACKSLILMWKKLVRGDVNQPQNCVSNCEFEGRTWMRLKNYKDFTFRDASDFVSAFLINKLLESETRWCRWLCLLAVVVRRFRSTSYRVCSPGGVTDISNIEVRKVPWLFSSRFRFCQRCCIYRKIWWGWDSDILCLHLTMHDARVKMGGDASMKQLIKDWNPQRNHHRSWLECQQESVKDKLVVSICFYSSFLHFWETIHLAGLPSAKLNWPVGKCMHMFESELSSTNYFYVWARQLSYFPKGYIH